MHHHALLPNLWPNVNQRMAEITKDHLQAAKDALLSSANLGNLTALALANFRLAPMHATLKEAIEIIAAQPKKPLQDKVVFKYGNVVNVLGDLGGLLRRYVKPDRRFQWWQVFDATCPTVVGGTSGSSTCTRCWCA